MMKRFAAVLMTLALALTMSGCSILFPRSSLYSYEATGKGNAGNKAYTGTTVFDPSYYPYYSMLGSGAKDAAVISSKTTSYWLASSSPWKYCSVSLSISPWPCRITAFGTRSFS